ncbi:hypothetical protein AVEN_214802-1 [Araneus ventricosus]|uniref:RNase H type-1 domain-containing protein n=1 Tax=Araneus ventricosus TaxID=182803 RepID=A0A4Y2RIV8_ARAVE|nr:hypothetical protein AVEN_214802-1 [Araneus ventricosus]
MGPTMCSTRDPIVGVAAAGLSTMIWVLRRAKGGSKFVDTTRWLFWDGPRHFEPRSDDEDDCAGAPSPNYLTTPTGGVGLSVCILDGEIQHKIICQKLEPQNTVFQAELADLSEAMDWATENKKKINIYTDSRSSIEDLKWGLDLNL